MRSHFLSIKTLRKALLIFLIAFGVIFSLTGVASTSAATTIVKVSHFGGIGGAGGTDGDIQVAQFANPQEVTFDQDDNAYVVDRNGIRKISSSGIVSSIYKFAQSMNGELYCSINIDKKDVIWIANCQGTSVIRISKSGSILNQISLPSNNSWMNASHSAGFLPDGRLLIPIWNQGKILAVAENGSFSDFYSSGANISCGGVTPNKTSATICPSSLAVSDTGEVLITDRSSNYALAKIDLQKNITRLSSVSSPGAIRFRSGKFYVQSSTYGNFQSLQIFRLNDSYSTELVYTGPLDVPYAQTGFDINSLGEVYYAMGTTNQIRVFKNITQTSKIFGKASLGSQDGPIENASFSHPTGITEDDAGNIYVRDYNGVRKISSSGVVTTIYRSDISKMDSGLFYVDGRIYFRDATNYLVSIDQNGSLQRHFVFGSGNDYASSVPREMAMDRSKNVYTVITKNGDYATRFVRKYSITGTSSDLLDISVSNSQVSLAVDSSGNLNVAANNLIRKYTPTGNLISNSTSISTQGYGTILALSSNDDVYTLSQDAYAITLSRSTGTTNEILVAGFGIGSENNGRASTFNNPNAFIVSKSGAIYISDTDNNVIRKVELSVGNDPTPTPTPTSTKSTSPTPTPSKSAVKPDKPSFNAVKFVGNTINISVNLGSSSTSRPDSVYLVAPKLGITSNNRMPGIVNGNNATWAVKIDQLLSGTAIPLEIVGVKDDVESEPLTGSYVAPKAITDVISDPSKNLFAPVKPSNAQYKVVGKTMQLSATLTKKANANATFVYLTAPSIGVTSDNSIEGKIAGANAIFVVPASASMAGKSISVFIFAGNEVGDSSPLQTVVKVPGVASSVKVPTPTKTTAPVKTVICQKGPQTRTFVASSCPPGWNK